MQSLLFQHKFDPLSACQIKVFQFSTPPKYSHFFISNVLGNSSKERTARGASGGVSIVVRRRSWTWRELVVNSAQCSVVELRDGCDASETTEPSKGTMVLQVLDLVSASGESFYGDCPVQTYTDLDINSTGHITCTVVPQGSCLNKFYLFQ